MHRIHANGNFRVDEDKSLRLYNLGTPVKIEHYVEPTDEWSLEEYVKDK